MAHLQKVILIFFFSGIIYSCQEETAIVNDPVILEFFSKEEAKDLEQIHDFFTAQIRENMSEEKAETSTCYDLYLEEFIETVRTGELDWLIMMEDIQALFDDLESDVFNHIWEKKAHTNYFGDKYYTLSIKPESKYMDFIEAVGENDETIAGYYQDFQRFGKISITLEGKMFDNIENYNTSDPKVRLLIAIHFLTMYY